MKRDNLKYKFPLLKASSALQNTIAITNFFQTQTLNYQSLHFSHPKMSHPNPTNTGASQENGNTAHAEANESLPPTMNNAEEQEDVAGAATATTPQDNTNAVSSSKYIQYELGTDRIS